MQFIKPDVSTIGVGLAASMGAVLHTLNIRLPGAQLAQIVNHAADRIIIVDDSLVPLLAKISDELPTVEAFIVNGASPSSDASASALGRKPGVGRGELVPEGEVRLRHG